MKLIIDNIIFSLQKAGGVSIVWSEMIKRILKNIKLDTEFLEYKHSSKNIFRNTLKIPNSKIIHINIASQLIRFNNPYLFMVKNKFIFHSTYYRVCKNKNAINITTVHDFTYEYFRKGLSKKIHCWQKYNAIRKSELIVCISQNTKKDLLKFLPEISPDRIKVIYNGVSDEYHIVANNNKDLIPFDKGKYILFVGSRIRYKNFDIAVEAIKNSKYKFVIVGSALSKNEKITLDAKIGSENYINLVNIKNSHLNTLYNNAFALIYPSSYEGFGIPILEAQKAGCPVIAFNSSSISEIIGDKTLLINELNGKNINECLNILEDDKIRQKIIQNGLENSSHYTWDKTYKELTKVYEDIWLK